MNCCGGEAGKNESGNESVGSSGQNIMLWIGVLIGAGILAWIIFGMVK